MTDLQASAPTEATEEKTLAPHPERMVSRHHRPSAREVREVIQAETGISTLGSWYVVNSMGRLLKRSHQRSIARRGSLVPLGPLRMLYFHSVVEKIIPDGAIAKPDSAHELLARRFTPPGQEPNIIHGRDHLGMCMMGNAYGHGG